MSSLAIVIVNWNSGSQLRECIGSLDVAAAHMRPGQVLAQIVVVDNASCDGSERDLPATASPLRLIRNDVNLGFAAACNQGAHKAGSDFILFLNPDTRLFDESLSVPASYLDRSENARTGIVGIAMVDDSGKVVPSCARFPRVWHFASKAMGLDRIWPRSGHYMIEWDHAQTRQVDQVIGAFFMVRRVLFESLGGFDERFFVYFEEVDFAMRAHRAGWASVYLAEARAYHKGGGTSGAVRDLRLCYSLSSRLQYGGKHFALAERLLLWAATFLLEPLSRFAHLVIAGRWTEIREVVAAYVMLFSRRRPRHCPARPIGISNSSARREMP